MDANLYLQDKEIMKLKTLIVSLAIGTLLLLAAEPSPAATWHVAPAGNDANPGTEARPFATLARAREEIRGLKRAGPLAAPVDIAVHAGAYRLTESLAFGPEDSGTAAAPVIWHAVPGEEVRLHGGWVLDDFQTVTNETVLKRLDPAAAGQVVVADLSRLGAVTRVEFPASFRGVPAVPELFFNDRRLALARWPNEGWATIARIVDSGSVPREGEKPDRAGSFEYAGARPARWNVAAGVWLQGYWCFDWYEETIQVKAIDREQRRITLARPSLYGIKPGNPSARRYRAWNLLEELDEPGEFYLDRATGSLYLWPPAPLDKARVVLSTLNAPLVSFQNTEHVVWRGFILEAGLANGMEVTGGRGITIEACTARNTRLLGISVSGGAGHRVVDCDIYDTGTGGLVLEGGDRKTLTPAGHEAVNNHIWRFSRHQLTSAYGLILGGVGNRAAHNLIHDAPHQAVALQGNDHLFEYNVVRNVVSETDDAGALYKGRNPSCRGNVIRHNFWRDIGSPMGHGTAAIYFDDGDGGDTVFGNVFFRCGFPGKGSFATVFSHGGHDLRAENNVFIQCQRALGSAPWDDARWRDALAGGQDCHWQELLLRDVDITRPPYTTHYPELVGFMNPQPGQPRLNRAKNNVFIHCGEISSGNWKYAPAEMCVDAEDSGFEEGVDGHFQLRTNAPVFKRLPGFQPIPFERIGLQGSRAGIH